MRVGERRAALSFALRVHRVCCVSRVAGVLIGRRRRGRERHAKGARACGKLSVQTSASCWPPLSMARPHHVQHHQVVRACVRWASRDPRVQSRVRARVKAASMRCGGPARERGLGEVRKSHTSMGREGGFF